MGLTLLKAGGCFGIVRHIVRCVNCLVVVRVALLVCTDLKSLADKVAQEYQNAILMGELSRGVSSNDSVARQLKAKLILESLRAIPVLISHCMNCSCVWHFHLRASVAERRNVALSLDGFDIRVCSSPHCFG